MAVNAGPNALLGVHWNDLLEAPQDSYPATLRLDQFTTFREHFQHRQDGEDPNHVHELKELLKVNPDGLGPITVWASNHGYIVLNGHHRLLAYEELGLLEAIPVTFFQGTRDEAEAHSQGGNDEITLNLTKADHRNIAWRNARKINTDGTFPISKAQIVRDRKPHVANGTVGNMRAVATKLREAALDPLKIAKWPDAQKAARGLDGPTGEAFDEEAFREQQKEDFRKRLKKTFGNQIYAMPDVFAEALAEFCGHRRDEVGRHFVEAFGGDYVFQDEEDANF